MIEMMMSLGGASQGGDSDPVDEWTQLTSSSIARYSPAAGYVGGNVIVYSGYDATFMNDPQSYDPVTDTWTNLPTGPRAVSGTATCVVDDIMYVTCGYYSTTRYKNIYSYNPGTGLWTAVTTGSLTGRNDHSAVAIGTDIYIHGGYPGSNPRLADTWKYDTVAKTWTQRSSSPVARSHHGAAVLDGKMYIFGGHGGTVGGIDNFNVYDPVANSWVTLSTGPSARYGSTMVAINGKLYVFGGYTTSGRVQELWRYDPATDEWTQLSDGATARSHHVALAINGKMFIHGGVDAAGQRTGDVWVYG